MHLEICLCEIIFCILSSKEHVVGSSDMWDRSAPRDFNPISEPGGANTAGTHRGKTEPFCKILPFVSGFFLFEIDYQNIFKCMLHWWKLMWRQEENSVLYRSEKRMCDLWKESWLYFKAQECLEKNFFVFLFLIWRGWCSGWWLMTWWWLAWRSRILRENKSTFEFKAAHFASTLLERPRI